ncbi:MAG: hypothetical protein ACYTG7_11665, partial [Planctomycetota bacterium]
MNTQMKTLIILMSLIAFCLILPSASGQAVVKLDSEGYQAMLEDLEIMSRLLEKKLTVHVSENEKMNIARLEALRLDRDEEKSAALDAYRLALDNYKDSYSTAFSFCDSFNIRCLYVPGSGAVFSMEIEVPAQEVDVEEDEEEAGDLWKETETELRRGHSLNTLKQEQNKTWMLDAETMDSIIDLLVKTMVKHGKNIEQLGDSDMITLVVTFKGKRPLDTLAALGVDTALAIYSYWSAGSSTGLYEDVIIQIPV